MTDNYDDEEDFRFTNYPSSGEETEVRDVVLGPTAGYSAILITVEPDGVLDVTVGNGPDHEDAPVAVADMLETVAGIIRSLDTNEAYWEALTQAQAEEE